jgi:hypothetical protein
MARFIQIGDEIINLRNVLRVERGKADGEQTVVLIYYAGDDRSQTQFTDARAEAVWQKFVELADVWEVPATVSDAPAGPGRTARRT